MFEVNEDNKGQKYIEVRGPDTPKDWKDVRVAMIPEGSDKNQRTTIRLYNWTGRGTGRANVDVPIDAIPALKQAIDYLLVEGAKVE